MSKKVKDSEYICLSAILRAKEARLLSRAKLERMLSEPGFAEACRVAAEAGYENMSEMTVAEINATLAAHRAAEIADICDLLPDESVLDFYRLRYDYHNAKVLVKSKGDLSRSAELVSMSGRYSMDELKEAYDSEDGSGVLPAAFGKAISEAKQALARTNNPQLADFILDKVYYAEELKAAQQLGRDFFTEFVCNRIDRTNICSALRILHMGKRSDLLRQALIEGGHVSADELAANVESKEDLIRLYAGSIFSKALEAPDMTEFEKEADNAMRDFLVSGNFINYGPEVVVEYMSAIENEILSLRIILTGKRIGIDAETLRERLRESYV